MSACFTDIAAKTKTAKAAARKKKVPAPKEPVAAEVPFAYLTFESLEVFLAGMRTVAKLTDAVGKLRKGMPTSFGDGFLVSEDGTARFRATLTLTNDPAATPGLIELVVPCGALKVEAEQKTPDKVIKKVSVASAANQTFQSAAVRTALAESMGVLVLEKAAAVLCAEANERGGEEIRKPRTYPKTVASDADTRHAKMHLVAQVLGLAWRNTKNELVQAAPAGKAQKKAFVDKSLTILADKLLKNPAAIMEVPAVRKVYMTVTGVEPAAEVKTECFCCGAKGCSSCKVVMVNSVAPDFSRENASSGATADIEAEVQAEEEAEAEVEAEAEAELADKEAASDSEATLTYSTSYKRCAADMCEGQPSTKKTR